MSEILTFKMYREIVEDLNTCKSAVVIYDQILIRAEKYLVDNPTFYEILLKAIEEIYPDCELSHDKWTVENGELTDYEGHSNVALQCAVSFILYQIDDKEREEAEGLNNSSKVIRNEDIDRTFTFCFSKTKTINLLKRLKKNNFIQYNNIDEIVKIFSGVRLVDIKEKIIWTDINDKKVSCYHGIFSLVSEDLKKEDSSYPKTMVGVYKLIQHCFCKANGKDFGLNELKQSFYRKIEKEQSKNLSERDEILKKLIKEV